MLSEKKTGYFNPAVIVLTAVLAAGAGIWFQLSQSTDGSTGPLQTAIAYPTPRVLAPFELVDSTGNPYGSSDLAGDWTLLFFGFTHCPDVCPTTLSMLDKTLTNMESSGQPVPEVVFVSVDPERDRGTQLGEYTRFFNPGFKSVTGSHEALEAFATDVGAVFRVDDHEPGSRDYNVDHSTSLLLIDPEGRLTAQIRQPAPTAAIAADLSRLMQ